MKFYGDYHTHSKHSDGRQSEEEIIEAARRKGLKEVAITDHGPLAAVIGINDANEYIELKEKFAAVNELNVEPLVLLGAEANIRDLKGTLDIPDEVIDQLDILIAGLHPYTLSTSIKDEFKIFIQNSMRHLGKSWKEKAINANTKASVEAIYNNPRLDILSHPGLFFEINIKEVVLACIKNEVLFEINCGHEYPNVSDIIEADKIGAEFIINSDSHFQDTVGSLDYGSRMVDKLKIDHNRVVNRWSGGGYQKWGKKIKAYTYL